MRQDANRKPSCSTLLERGIREAEVSLAIASGDSGMLQRYGNIVEGNFVAWLVAAAISVRSVEARAALMRNIHAEVTENHSGLLHEFLLDRGAYPDRKAAVAVAAVLSDVRGMCARGDGLSILALLCFLESLSPRFLPILDRIGATSADVSPYVRAHVAADVDHAVELRAALQAEVDWYSNPSDSLRAGIVLGQAILDVVFSEPSM